MHDGKTVDLRTHLALKEAERRLGYPLTVTQGSYNAGGVAASAGTHDGGGAVDLEAYDWQRKVRVLRAVGFAAWYRPELWRDGVKIWGPHVHAIQIGNDRLSDGARAQVADYYAGRDGLAGDGPDPYARPNPIPVFPWPVTHTRGARTDALIERTAVALAHAKGHVRKAALRASLRALRSIPKRVVL